MSQSFTTQTDTSEWNYDSTTYTPVGAHPWLKNIEVKTVYFNDDDQPDNDRKVKPIAVEVAIYTKEGDALAMQKTGHILTMMRLAKDRHVGDIELSAQASAKRPEEMPWITCDAGPHSKIRDMLAALVNEGDIKFDMSTTISQEIEAVWHRMKQKH